MKLISKDARGFIDGVATYIRNDRRGTQILPKVQSLFARVTSAAKKERVAIVITVVSLSAGEKVSIQKMLEHILGHEVDCHFDVSQELLGGMKIQVADWVVDTSLESSLSDLSRSLS